MPRGIKEIIQDSRSLTEAKRVEMFDSLLEAVGCAGGSRTTFLKKVIEENMTVVELIDSLAQNDVRFIYIGDNK